MPPSRAAALSSLGLSAAATADDAKAAFRKLALRYHPDKNPSPDAASRFHAISDAFEALMSADDRQAEAEAILADPLAEVLGANWARGFADGSIDPEVALKQARQRALAGEVGDESEMEELRAMLDSMPAGVGGFGDLEGIDLASLGGAGALPELTPEMMQEGGNPFKAFFDAMPESQRGPMMALFEKTFPAFLANEMEEQQLHVENELFARALRQNRISPTAHEDNPGSQDVGIDEKSRLLAEEFNAEAIKAFEQGRYRVAADALTEAISLDPNNAAFYGNRSLAHERGDRFEEALADAERCICCDPTYAPGYERKGRALLGLRDFKGAVAACRRGIIVDSEHAGLQSAFEEAQRAAAAHKLDIVRTGSDVLGLSPADYLGPADYLDGSSTRAERKEASTRCLLH
ncbi:MAG: hypothetical protein SGPRY_011874 [Prymnesium sp.]